MVISVGEEQEGDSSLRKIAALFWFAAVRARGRISAEETQETRIEGRQSCTQRAATMDGNGSGDGTAASLAYTSERSLENDVI